MLYNVRDIASLVNQWGILPFFANEVEGFSIEENISPDYWFPREGEGVWEWKNEVMIEADCAYGKFYRGKACFVSMKCYPDMVNLRRSLYNPTADEQIILQTVEAEGSLLSPELKKRCGYTRPHRPRATSAIERAALHNAPRAEAPRKGFDTAIARLQMGGRLLTAGFEYNYSRSGERYGWSIARYCTPSIISPRRP